jgi:hypothetical protein
MLMRWPPIRLAHRLRGVCVNLRTRKPELFSPKGATGFRDDRHSVL